MSDQKLPDGITLADLEHRYTGKMDTDAQYKKYCAWRDTGDGALVEPRSLTMHYTERFGWVITTLFISRGRNGTDRTYGVTLEGQACSLGNGPHIKRTITVYLRKSRLSDLQKYLDIYNAGLERSHEIRDTRSTRRAQGAMRRRSWGF